MGGGLNRHAVRTREILIISVQNKIKRMTKEIKIDNFSQTSYYVECLFDNLTISTGTCFFFKERDDYFLITNWHIVTGKNPQNKTCLRKDGAIPNKIKVKIFKNSEYIEWTDLIINLQDDNFNDLWLEHSIYKEKVDVVALKVQIPTDKLIFDIEQFIEPYNENTFAEIRDDVFIIGFPFGIKGGGEFPLWKRASIASEPDIDIDDLPKLFVDTASRPGMSGSPVIYKERRSVMIGNSSPKTATKFSRYFMQFIGVYSGRIGAENELKAQLGIVWKSSVIKEIINQ
ncbi:MAG: serine protease [Bacteroidota bacterium]